MPRKISQERLLKDVRRVLENPFFIPELSDEYYTRLHDDHDGIFEGNLVISILKDGDAVILTDKPYRSLRFRNFFGGGQSPRVRNALQILALAIKLDNEERPLESR